MRQPELGQPGNRFPVPFDELGRVAVSGLRRGVFVEDGAHTRFERVPGTGWAQTGPLCDEWADDRILGKVLDSAIEVQAEAGKTARSANDVNKPLPAGEVQAEQQMVCATRGQFQNTGVSIDDDRAAVGAVGHVFDAWSCPVRQ